MQKYFDEHGTTDANSTDVHAVKNTKSIISYMTKYMLKSDRYKKNQNKNYKIPTHYYHDKLNELDKDGKKVKRYIECALWNCSTELSKYKLNVLEEENIFQEISKTLRDNSTFYNTDHGTLYEYNSENIFKNIFQILKANAPITTS